MTYKQALLSGYTHGDRRWAQGYRSRRCDPDEQPLLYAHGKRRGQPYVELPSWASNRYHIRQYLIPPKEVETCRN